MRPPYNLTTLMYQLIVNDIKGRIQDHFCQPHKEGVVLVTNQTCHIKAIKTFVLG